MYNLTSLTIWSEEAGARPSGSTGNRDWGYVESKGQAWDMDKKGVMVSQSCLTAAVWMSSSYRFSILRKTVLDQHIHTRPLADRHMPCYHPKSCRSISPNTACCQGHIESTLPWMCLVELPGLLCL